MNHIKAVHRVDQASGAQIEKLFWIATSLETNEMLDFIADLASEQDINEIIPGFKQKGSTRAEIWEALIDQRKFGLIAQSLHPIQRDFTYHEKTGKPIGCSIGGSFHISYHYADTLPQLLKSVERHANAWCEYDIRVDKKKKGATSHD